MLYFFKCRALSDIDEATITAAEDNLFSAGDYTKGEEEMKISIGEPPAEEPCVSHLPETQNDWIKSIRKKLESSCDGLLEIDESPREHCEASRYCRYFLAV